MNTLPIQTFLGSVYSSSPIRWIETPELSRAAKETAVAPVDRDAGKPQSASGDVLDISQEAADKKESESAVPQRLASGEELNKDEQKKVDELKARDLEVKQHEQAHIAAGGQYVTSGPDYDYETGPDGEQYAVGGSVNISSSPVEGNPQATIEKMKTVIAAATAPAQPSGQDLKVAAQARQELSKAQMELAALKNPSENTEQDVETKYGNWSVVRSAYQANSAAAKSVAVSGFSTFA